jgi:hypothetical protein
MKNDMKIWLQEMKSYAEKCRASRPIPRQDTLSWPQVLQLNIIKGSLLSRINSLPVSISPNPDGQGGNETCIVFTSTSPGLVAIREIAQGKDLHLVSLYPEELHEFLQYFPDNEYKYHIHIWSYFLEELDSATTKNAARYPLKDKEKYWLHVEGTMHGLRFGRGVEHLWSWNGSQTKLLKKSFLHWAA